MQKNLNLIVSLIMTQTAETLKSVVWNNMLWNVVPGSTKMFIRTCRTWWNQVLCIVHLTQSNITQWPLGGATLATVSQWSRYMSLCVLQSAEVCGTELYALKGQRNGATGPLVGSYKILEIFILQTTHTQTRQRLDLIVRSDFKFCFIIQDVMCMSGCILWVLL